MQFVTLKHWITQQNKQKRDQWISRVAKSVAPDSRVLDVGAGGCPYRELFAHCTYDTQDFVGLRPDQLNQGAYGSMKFVCDATAIPAPDASYDFILCTEVLEHVPQPDAVIREVARLLRPGGTAVFTAPLGSGIHQEPHHYYGGFTPFWYQRIMNEAGFERISVEANGGSHQHFSQWCVWFIKAVAPWQSGLGVIRRLFYFFIWLVTAPPTVGLMLLSRLLDKVDGRDDFTVGYHVKAERMQNAVNP